MRSDFGSGVGRVPLSFAQQRLWLLDRIEPGSPAYNVILAFRLCGQLDRTALTRALTEIASRHEVLRATFVQDGDDVVQEVTPADSAAALPMVGLAAADGEDPLDKFVRETGGEPFDLACGPLWRARLARLAPDDHAFVVVLHHAVYDGWSEAVLLAELSALYGAFRQGQPSPLPDLPLQYADYAARQQEWLGGREYARQLDYWKRELSDAPAPVRFSATTPRGAPRPKAGARVWLRFDAEISASIEELASRERCTPYMVLLSAFAVLLSRYSDQGDLVVGAPVADRNQPELEKLIGFFVNTLALRLDLSGEPSFRELLGRVRAKTLGAWDHQDLPFEKLVAELNPERTDNHAPFFRAMFILQNTPASPLTLDGLEVERIDPPVLAPKADLIVNVEQGATLRAEFVYDASVFDEAAVERMAGHYRVLLEAALQTPEQPVSHLPLMSDAWRRRVIEEWNATDSDYPRSESVPALFREHARRAPQAIAIEDGVDTRTYERLDDDSDRIAGHLLRAGTAPGALVAMCAERTADAVTALLGILKAGAAYVPLDRSLPAARLMRMLADARPVVVLVSRACRARLPETTVPVLVIDDLLGDPVPGVCAAVAPAADSPAYVLFTSGSTGIPKGVVVPHRSIVRLVRGADYVRLQPDDCVAQLATLSFDAATFEIWGALLNGARLAIISRDVSLDPDALAALIKARGISTMFLTTALFHEIARENPAIFGPLKQLLFGGEVCDPRWVRAVLEHNPALRPLHVYGPTENTTFSTWYPVREVASDSIGIPIGRPIANTRAYILDRHLQPMPPGVEGELYLGGDGLALGYLNDPELTARSFVDTPYGRLYRTGDLARYTRDGDIEFAGRRDAQVKLRGFRIELGEIEAALSTHAAVREAAVLCQGEGDGKSLVAYVAPSDGTSATVLREYLRAHLPGYMVPAIYVFLDRLPLNRNGKVDRAALPAFQRGTRAREDVAEDRIDTALAAIWRELLGVSTVRPGDDFFALGGHSLLAVRLVARIEKDLGVCLPVSVLFESSTLSRLAEAIRRGGVDNAPVLLRPLGTLPPVFFLQAGLYLKDLVAASEDGLRLYAVASPGPESLSAQLDLEQFARLSVQRLLAVHKDGPIFLAGYCYGGVLALEVAHQLETMGHHVALVAVFGPPVLDVPAAGAVSVRLGDLAPGRDGMRHALTLLRLPLPEWPVYIGERLHSTHVRLGYLRWRICMRVCALLRCSPPRWLRNAWQNIIFAVRRYVPRPVAARIVLLATGEDSMPTEEELHASWSPLAPGGLEIRYVPGLHDTMMKPPHVAAVARELGAAVAEASALRSAL
jgi:amino acid adenylation domain-containing protein